MFKNDIPLEKGKVVPSELILVAQGKAKQQITADLDVPDPDKESAEAALQPKEEETQSEE